MGNQVRQIFLELFKKLTNHTAANRAGIPNSIKIEFTSSNLPNMNTCDEPTIVCATKVSQNLSKTRNFTLVWPGAKPGCVDRSLSHAPKQLPKAPINNETLSP